MKYTRERTVVFVALLQENTSVADISEKFRKREKSLVKDKFNLLGQFEKINNGRISFLVMWLDKTPPFFLSPFSRFFPVTSPINSLNSPFPTIYIEVQSGKM